MRNTSTNIIAFAVGAVIGSAAAWIFTRKYYEHIADEEIESMRDYYLGKKGEPVEKDEDVEESTTDGSSGEQLVIQGYANQLQDMGYTNYSNNARPSTPVKKTIEEEKPTPYVIEPDEFGRKDGHDTTFLTYYADGVLAYDDNDEIIEDTGDIVGDNFSEHFGDYEKDVVHIRNDEARCDYEITKDLRKYLDVVNVSPHQAEDEWDETK